MVEFRAYYVDLLTGEKIEREVKLTDPNLSYKNSYMAAVSNAYDYVGDSTLHLLRVDFISF